MKKYYNPNQIAEQAIQLREDIIRTKKRRERKLDEQAKKIVKIIESRQKNDKR